MEDFGVLNNEKVERVNVTIKYISYLAFVLALCSTAIFGCRCSTSKQAPDPLAGWARCWSQDPKDFDKITTDYRAYINSLPQELRVGVGPIEYLEDKTGQHAIRFETGIKGVSWSYVLIYDKENKRIKVIKYVSGYYRS